MSLKILWYDNATVDYNIYIYINIIIITIIIMIRFLLDVMVRKLRQKKDLPGILRSKKDLVCAWELGNLQERGAQHASVYEELWFEAMEES